jgi:hypothetical protein
MKIISSYLYWGSNYLRWICSISIYRSYWGILADYASRNELRDKVQEVAMPVRNLFAILFLPGLTLEFTDEVPAIGLLITIVVWSICPKYLSATLEVSVWLDKRGRLKQVTLTPRGEFSVIIAGPATGVVQIFPWYPDSG